MREEFLLSKSARSFFIFFDYIRVALIFVVGILLVYYLVVQVFVVKGASMDPNFADSELIIVNRINYYFSIFLAPKAINTLKESSVFPEKQF
jgi:signal peptidase I